MGRHGMSYCLLCNPFGNGSSGTDGTEAIGKYYLPDYPGEDQHSTGWHGVCEICADMVENQGFAVEPLPGHEDHDFFQPEPSPDMEDACDSHDWHKESLVTESEGYDIVRCTACDIFGKRHGLGSESVEVVGWERP